MREEYIDCPSCGDKVLRGASCETCVTWREENDEQNAKLKAEVELLNAKVKSLEDELPEYCGKNDVFPKGRVGCGEPFVWSPQVFRCVDCSMPFHKHCLKKHCDDDLANVRTDLEREHAANAKLREALEGVLKSVALDWYLEPFDTVALEAARQALLAAKQDDCSRCKHGIHGKDCYQCYPSDAKQDEGDV